jgi:integrase
VGLYQVMSAFRQACGAGVRWGFMASNPAQAVGQNPQAPVVELEPLTIREVEALAVELGPVYGSAVIVACETATRPSEWAGLQRRDVDRERGVVRVERTVVDGREKPYGKTTRSRRSIPLSSRALEALNELPIQLTSPYLFPAARGGPIGLDSWRSRCWYPALESAGIERCGPYVLRHTGITTWLASGVAIYDVSRYAGTSLEMVSRTYGHLAKGSEQVARDRIDAYRERELERLGVEQA